MYVKFDMTYTCKRVLQELLKQQAVDFELHGINEIEFKKELPPQVLDLLKGQFADYGIEVIDDQKQQLIQRIKDLIVDLVWNKDEQPNMNMSTYLSEQLQHSYGYLTSVFSEVTLSSIENYAIIQKIERAKHLLLHENRSLTDISYMLNYSSVAHLSAQFKKTTGLTPSLFQSIIKKRKQQKLNTE